LTTLIYNYFTRPPLGLLGREVEATLAALLPPSVRLAAALPMRRSLAGRAAIATAEVAAPADVEHRRAPATARLAQGLLVASVRHRPRRSRNLLSRCASSLHCFMSRGKKSTKAEQSHRRDKRERAIADKIADLSCGYAAADSFAAMCGLAQEEAGFNVDMVMAAEALWRRAARADHPLTAALVELRAELERQREVMRAFEQRFDAQMRKAPHDHIKPEPDDVQRIRAALLGPSGPAAPLSALSAS